MPWPTFQALAQRVHRFAHRQLLTAAIASGGPVPAGLWASLPWHDGSGAAGGTALPIVKNRARGGATP